MIVAGVCDEERFDELFCSHSTLFLESNANFFACFIAIFFLLLIRQHCQECTEKGSEKRW